MKLSAWVDFAAWVWRMWAGGWVCVLTLFMGWEGMCVGRLVSMGLGASKVAKVTAGDGELSRWSFKRDPGCNVHLQLFRGLPLS